MAGLERLHEASHHSLLDLDPDLADELEPELRRVVRAAATTVTLEIEPGRVELERVLEGSAGGPGVLVADGVLALSVTVADRTTAELIGAGDLLQPLWRAGDRLLACEASWRALAPSRVAVLDEAFARRVRFWPQISLALMRRAGRRVVNLDIQRAIAAQPRLEVRLALLLWHLAGRWGRVEPSGIHLRLPLSHSLLGHLIAAERPSVSHALGRLAHSGLVTGHGGDWHLHGSLEDRLPTMLDATADRAERIVQAVGAGSRVTASRRA